MDVICVMEEDGEFRSTPFYVGFSTSAIFTQPLEEKVNTHLNAFHLI